MDIKDPVNPQVLDKATSDFSNVFFLDTTDTFACVVTSNRTLTFFDLTDPAKPRQISHLNTEDIHQMICTENQVYYVTANFEDDFSTLHVMDVTDLTKPHETAILNLPKYVQDIAFVNGYLYGIVEYEVSSEESELIVIDASDETNPRQVGTLSGILDRYAVDMSLADHYVYVVGEDVWAIDVSDPTEPRPVGNLDIPGYYAYDSVMVDDKLFVADGYGGLVILDVHE